MNKKILLWEEQEKTLASGAKIHWRESVDFSLSEIEGLSKKDTLAIARGTNGCGWGRNYARKICPEWAEKAEGAEKAALWKKGGVLGIFLLWGGGTFTLRISPEGEIRVPAGEKGRVIGKAGYRIKDIQTVTGLKASITTIIALANTVKFTVWNYNQ